MLQKQKYFQIFKLQCRNSTKNNSWCFAPYEHCSIWGSCTASSVSIHCTWATCSKERKVVLEAVLGQTFLLLHNKKTQLVLIAELPVQPVNTWLFPLLQLPAAFLWRPLSEWCRSSKRLTNLLLWIKAGFALLFFCHIETWKPLKSLAEWKLCSSPQGNQHVTTIGVFVLRARSNRTSYNVYSWTHYKGGDEDFDCIKNRWSKCLIVATVQICLLLVYTELHLHVLFFFPY